MATALVAVAALVASVVPAAPAQGQSGSAPCDTTHWVGTWAADPSGTLGSGSSDQTVRVILSPHIGGSALRVHLSNRFGRSPVTFNHASVALRQAGAGLVPGSSRPLTFGGLPTVTVPVGGEVTSDQAMLSFSAFQDLAVSVYLAAPTGPATGHLIGRERSYVTVRGGGDHTTDDGSGAFPNATTTVNYVDGVDALASTGIGAAVLFGDSITDGYESSGGSSNEEQGGIDLNHRYPDYLARRLLGEAGGPRLSVVDAGVSGNRLLVDAQNMVSGMSGLSRLGTDVIGVPGVTDAIVLAGINDIALLASAGQVESALRQIVTRLHAAGIHTLLGTLSPAGTGLLNLGNLLPSIYIDSSANAVRVAVNGWIRSGASGADGVVDFDAALRGASISDELNAGFDSGDHVHPSYSGYKKMADIVDLSSLRGATCGAGSIARLATTLRVRARARSGGRIHVSGSLIPAGRANCTGDRVVVRALSGGHTLFKRAVRVAPSCLFADTKSTKARGRIEVRVGFAGSLSLLPSKTRSLYVHAR